MPTDTLEWRETEKGLVPVLLRGKTEVETVWAPQDGSQIAFSDCPVFECVFEGNRGLGKTDGLIMSYLQHVGKGWGEAWAGVLFRRTYPQLGDVIAKCNKWIPRIFPQAKYNRSEHVWSFPDGELLLLRHFLRPEDYWNYHGHEYPWVGWEELSTWPTSECLRSMIACARSPVPGIPNMVRATTNPYGVGHNWIKKRYRLMGIPQFTVGPVIRDSFDEDGDLEPERVYVHGDLRENKVLLYAQPNYISNIKAAARNPAELRAWLYGDWDIVAGGMLDDLWDGAVHVVPNFPPQLIPKTWYIDRSYDHGQSHPFSVGWWAESPGEPFTHKGFVYGKVRGDTYRFAEWYGCDPREDNLGVRMKATDIAQGILDREEDMGLKGRVRPGPADNQIFDDNASGEGSPAGDMLSKGVRWGSADQAPGSRKLGWQKIRVMLSNAFDPEEPALYVTERCVAFRRTVPTLPRSDRDLDDVNKEAEDHIGDETRYRLRYKRNTIESGVWR